MYRVSSFKTIEDEQEYFSENNDAQVDKYCCIKDYNTPEPVEVATLPEAAALTMKDMIYEACKLVSRTGCMFADAEFPADDSSLYKDANMPPLYSLKKIEWLRPHELC